MRQGRNVRNEHLCAVEILSVFQRSHQARLTTHITGLVVGEIGHDEQNTAELTEDARKRWTACAFPEHSNEEKESHATEQQPDQPPISLWFRGDELWRPGPAPGPPWPRACGCAARRWRFRLRGFGE